ncbi:MAG: CocE/NonD family hydrolase [Dinghuibacter sp.]|nr:CocE/NonD family hydrolase [Dinghuibacter sp.]
MRTLLFVFCSFFMVTVSWAQTQPIAAFVREHYTKKEYEIPMRDGIKLFTAVYTPKDASETNRYPFMLNRTCYSISPYGETAMKLADLGPSETMIREKYIFVHQDVRGRYKSEGVWTNMTPHIPSKKTSSDIDESSDAFDTMEWLLKNIAHHNGKAGIWGISYPGFYTSASSIDAHPALKACSPQAPIADFFFDDFHHNGAYTLGYFWNTPLFGTQKTKPTTTAWFKFFEKPTPDSYDFFLNMGSLKNGSKYYGDENFFWKELTEHHAYDEFWKKRRIVQHLRNVKPAYLVVGGWFDAEDLYGALTTYKEIEKNNPGAYNTLVMGPFGHGDWSREKGRHRHYQMYFGDSIATWYQRNLEARFFYHFLKGSGEKNAGLPEAAMFNTGAHEWKMFEQWPPAQAQKTKLYFDANGRLTMNAPTGNGFGEYISDPAKPVPYTADIAGSFGITPYNYMSEDQRFASRRTDVLTFQTEELAGDLTLGGEITVNLQVSTTGTDADWVVKLVDVFPGNAVAPAHAAPGTILGGYQMMVRSEVMRSRFRNSYEKPEPVTPNKIIPIKFKLQDVLHTFKKGHRLMIQVQSSWFPLIDRNPQKFVPNIYKAEDADFIKATHRVYHSAKNASFVEVDVLK